jgi:ubiquinone/menaquinone biosynthesis C-methylase UbiE
MKMTKNIDEHVVADFGREWAQFDQSGAPIEELRNIFEQYFSLFPWEMLSPDAEGFDLGCGSGRWAYFCAPRVGKLHCIDPAVLALEVAKKKLSKLNNCIFHNAGVGDIPLDDGVMDFGYSLGVLHHIPDTEDGIRRCVRKLKPGAPFLVYLYYAFDNRPLWFKAVWRASDILRRGISILPYPLKYLASQAIALFIYFPLSRFAHIVETLGFNVSNLPLSSYRDKSFYSLRTDALDRFGTRLEKRFTKSQIEQMMIEAGLERIEFRNKEPFWCAVGYRTA